MKLTEGQRALGLILVAYLVHGLLWMLLGRVVFCQ
jgi:hypothetical protein